MLLHDLALCESYDYCSASHWFIDTPASSNEDMAGGKRSLLGFQDQEPMIRICGLCVQLQD